MNTLNTKKYMCDKYNKFFTHFQVQQTKKRQYY